MLIALDFETTGLQMYSPKHSVVCAAIAYRQDGELKSEFIAQNDVLPRLTALQNEGHTFCVYNIGFERLVLRSKFPSLNLDIKCDVMRLVQNYDNGEDIFSFGLKAAAKRLLPPNVAEWEIEMKDWLYKNKGAGIHEAPQDVLHRYNVGDAIATLLLYELITEEFEKEGFNWRTDHSLYMSSAVHVVDAKLRGVRVDCDRLLQYTNAVSKGLENNEVLFRYELLEEITQTEQKITEIEQAKFKKKIVPPQRFNVDSNRHRELLFCDTMGIEPSFLTKTGRPSLKKSHLKQFGEAARLLEARKGRQVVLTQATNLLDLAQEDSRWHIDLKLVGTSTSRFAGGQQ
jgi:DNA polymerase I-like protein with 3'-5' exonuclease and polymerase domains